MAAKVCEFCTEWWMTDNVYHDGPCPQRKKQRKKDRTKKGKAEALLKSVDAEVAKAQALVREAEEALIDLEDRDARRAARRPRVRSR